MLWSEINANDALASDKSYLIWEAWLIPSYGVGKYSCQKQLLLKTNTQCRQNQMQDNNEVSNSINENPLSHLFFFIFGPHLARLIK